MSSDLPPNDRAQDAHGAHGAQDAQSNSRPTAIVASDTLPPGVLQRQESVWSRGNPGQNLGRGQGSLPTRGRGSSIIRGRGSLMGRRGVPPLTGKVFRLEGADVERARGSAFRGVRGRRPAGPNGQRAQASTPDAPSNNTFTPLAGSDSRRDPGFHGPEGPSSDAPDMSGSGATESENPNAPGSSPDAGRLDSSGGIDTLGTPLNINDDDQPDTTIQQLPTDAQCLRQQIDRKQAEEEAERQAEEEDDEIRRQLLEELQRACNKNVFDKELVVEHDGIDHDIM